MVKKKTAFLASNLHGTIVDEQRMYVEIPVRQTPYQINTKEKQVSKTKENKTKRNATHHYHHVYSDSQDEYFIRRFFEVLI